ncbi:MAG: TolC family protein [Bryobacteraceae bacterium]|nr:TolC family protein [Bryobacteraceae bacterium]
MALASESNAYAQAATPHRHAPDTAATETPVNARPSAGPPSMGTGLPPSSTAQTPVTGKRIRLEDLEQMALRRNPALSQAAAGIRTSEALRRQAGMYPNPLVGYSADEVNGGTVFNYGEHGVFAEQRFVTGGKLGIQRRLADQDITLARAEADAGRFRVLNTVRSLYYQALGEQRLLTVRTQLAGLARRAVQTTSELANVGQADRPDVLAVDIEAQRLELGLVQARNALQRTWRQMAAVTGNLQLEPGPLEGDLEALPNLDFDTELARINEQSPEIRAAQVGTARSDLAIREARASVIPDIIARGGLHYNRERLGVGGQPVGWQGSAEIGIQIPIFNRNQGNIAASRAGAERAMFAVERTRLELRSRLASAFREYQDSRAAIERYKTQMIPSAQRAYDLYLTSFRQMSAAYPQVVITQRNLFQLQEDYVATLISAWQRVVEIQTLLLTAGAQASGNELSGPATFRMSED